MKIIFKLLISSLLFSCSSEAQIYPDKNEATHQNPFKAGWGDTECSIFTRNIIDSTNVTGLVIINKEEVVHEYDNLEENSYLASYRKSI